MNITIDQRGNSKVAIIESGEVVIRDVQDALDLMANVKYAADCSKILLKQAHLPDDFFELRTKLAGDILQKYTNYGIRLAIVGEFDRYGSKSLNDFIYECNKGNRFFFLKDEAAALEALHTLA